MSYSNEDRRWMEDNFREITRRLSDFDKFMGSMQQSNQDRTETLNSLADELDEMRKALKENNDKTDGLLNKINKWEAKLGSFMFIAGCLWAFFVAMKDTIMTFIKGP